MKKKNEKPKPPTNLKAGDLNDWYAQQRQRELIERKNREEAEKYLRGYRSKFSYDTIAPANSATPVTEGSVVAEEGAHVSDEVGKLQKGLDTFPSLSFDESEEANEDEGDGDKYAVPEGGVVEEGVAHVPEEVEKLEEKIDASPTLNSDDVEETVTGDVVEADVEGDANDEDPATIVENEDVGTMEETTKGIDGQKDDEPEEFSLESSTLLEATAIVEDTETYESKTESVEEPLKEDAIADENSDQGSEPEENTESLPRSEVDDALSEEKEDVPVPVVQNDDSSVAKESLTVSEQVAESVTENDEEGADVEQKKEEGTDTANDDGWRFLISRGTYWQSSSIMLDCQNQYSHHSGIEPGSKFAPEPNRYHLYVAYACPWAHRTVIVRNLKGLQDVIGVTYVHPTWQFTNKTKDDHRGWVFGKKEGKSLSNTSGIGNFPSEWGEEDPLMGANSIRDIYLKVNDTTGKYILPVLWDKKYQTIVSNESSEIIRMLNSEFDEFATNDELDLYPSELQEEIDEVNKWVYPTFNNGVYRCGLSSTQEAYDDAIGKDSFVIHFLPLNCLSFLIDFDHCVQMN